MSGAKMDLEMDTKHSEHSAPSDEDVEHTERIDPTDELAAQEAERAERAKRKAESRANQVERWSHDKFDDEQQQPRTVQELVDRYGFDIRELDPTATDFSRPIAQNGAENDSMSESSTKRRERPTARRNPASKPNGVGRGGRREPKQTPPRREKTPQIKNQEEFPELKSNVKKEQRGQNRRDTRVDKKAFDKKDTRSRKPRGRMIKPDPLYLLFVLENGISDDVPRENKPSRRSSRTANNENTRNTRKDNFKKGYLRSIKSYYKTKVDVL